MSRCGYFTVKSKCKCGKPMDFEFNGDPTCSECYHTAMAEAEAKAKEFSTNRSRLQ